jgi:putative flavoprotein involved in K+ transport
MNVTTVVIGAGHSGLAMSRRLSERSIDHVLLERGQVANSWSTERWDSLRLLTPNWHTRLPGADYRGSDPDGYMSSREVADMMRRYAVTIEAPVVTDTRVTRVWRDGDDFRVETSNGEWRARTLVIASGAANRAAVPAVAEALPPEVASVAAFDYRNPDQLDERDVLVVGASATGVQLAEEIQRSGRRVTISVGEHVRMPRTYRGRDVFWWLDHAGVLAQTASEIDDLVRARSVPSPQLVGTSARTSLDVNALRRRGVRVVGRLGHIGDGRAQFAGSLANICALADLKMNRLLQLFDEWSEEAATADDLLPSERFEPTVVDPNSPLQIDLRSGQFGTVIWATGYQPDYSWLDLPVLDRKGRIRHDGGVVHDAPGCYVLGLNFLRRRGSTYISGATRDTDEIAGHLSAHLAVAPSY